MTHYPQLAQTFIANEIKAVESEGLAIARFAMNPPSPRERAVAGAGEEIARTTYLKEAPWRAAAALLGVTLRRPLALAGVWRQAIASGGASPGRIARRVAHLAQAARVADMARKNGITRLHAHFGLAPATIAWFAALIARAKGDALSFSFTIHGFHDFVDRAESRLDLKAEAACRVLCVSDFTRSQLYLSTSPGLWPRFAVARCGVDLARFAYRDPPGREGRVTVVALGRLSAEKGCAILVQAVAALKGSGSDIRLRFVGDGPQRVQLTELVSSLGLADSVEFVGELPPEAVRGELERADIFCMASFSEGLPISIMEAMAVGVPVVTTWIAGIPELAVDGVTALTVPPGEPAALARALQRLCDDGALRQRIARAARLAVEERHDQARCGAAVAALLREDGA